MEAYKVALISFEIQYDTSDRALTLLPNPEAKMKTPCNDQSETLGHRLLRLTYWKNLAGTSDANTNTSDAHQTNATPDEKHV